MVETFKDDAVELLSDFDNRARREAVKAKRRSAQTIPIIDFSAYTNGDGLEARQRVARALRAACTDTGFFISPITASRRASSTSRMIGGSCFLSCRQPRRRKSTRSIIPRAKAGCRSVA